MLSAHINRQPLMHVSQVKLPTSEYSFSRVKPDKSLCNRGCVRPAGGGVTAGCVTSISVRVILEGKASRLCCLQPPHGPIKYPHNKMTKITVNDD